MPRDRKSRTGVIAVLFMALGSHYPVQAEDIGALDCVINPHKVFDLGSGVPGVLDKLNVERSDYVEANQVVAELEAGVERANVAVARARAEITSELHLGELNLAFDERRKARIADLYAAQSVSIQNKEDAELEAQLSLWRLQEAQERESIRKLELLRAQEQLEQKIVRSPGSGFVLKNFKSEGEYVEDQPIVRIAQLDRLNVEVIAPMELFGKIKVGMSADVYPETLGTRPYRAEVSVVDRIGDTASGTFGVRLNLPNADYAVPAGVKCSLQFTAVGKPARQRPQSEQYSALPGPGSIQAGEANQQSLWSSVQPRPPLATPVLNPKLLYTPRFHGASPRRLVNTHGRRLCHHIGPVLPLLR